MAVRGGVVVDDGQLWVLGLDAGDFGIDCLGYGQLLGEAYLHGLLNGGKVGFANLAEILHQELGVGGTLGRGEFLGIVLIDGAGVVVKSFEHRICLIASSIPLVDGGLERLHVFGQVSGASSSVAFASVFCGEALSIRALAAASVILSEAFCAAFCAAR